MTALRLSILDQSAIPKGSNARKAILETISTARLAESLGYYRFWVSEHHNSPSIAGSTPEVLMARLAAETETLRIGSGGIMLPNHSALKVAENFRMLETMYPGRIDLGMGRAPGGDRITASMLNPSNTYSEESYLMQLEHLQVFFTDKAETQYGPLIAIPQAESVPQQWILSSTGGSAGIAARFGMGLAIAKFINGDADPAMVQTYRSAFHSRDGSEPNELVAVFVICSETEERAAQLRKLYDYVLIQFEKGRFDPMPSPEEISAYEFSDMEKLRIAANAGRIVSGNPDSVKQQLQQLADNFDVEEIMISTMTHNSAERKRSFELIAEAYNLTAAS